MFFEMFLRIFSDCCIFFGLLGCAPSLLPYSYPLPAAGLICAIAAAFASLLHNKSKRLLSCACALLPFLSLLMADGWREMLVLIVPILYTCVIILRGDLYLEYFHYRHFFIRSMWLLLGLWCAISAAVYIEDPKKVHEQVIFTSILLRYTVVHFTCGVILQRQLRMGEASHSHGGAGQVVGMLGSAGVTALCFAVTDSLFQNKILQLLRGSVTVVMMLLTPLAELLMKARKWRMERQLLVIENWKKTAEHPDDILDMDAIRENSAILQETEGSPVGGNSAWLMIIAIVGVLIFVVLMFLVFSSMRTKKEASFLSSEVHNKEKSRKSFSRLSNRARVRQAYRDFLHLQKQKGFVLKKHYTTADIMQKVSAPETETAAAQLREVYLRARYDENREITRQQADAARSAVRSIKAKSKR